MHTASPPQLSLALPQEAVAGFASLLQHGIRLALNKPMALLPVLLSLPGFSQDYIANRVQTLFINGVAADSFDRVLSDGDTVALSAAMPGLAGAIFRRQGRHGSLRSQPQEKGQVLPSESGVITLKLFNSIATDRVADLLLGGISITGKAFHDFAARRENLFQPPAVLLFEGRGVNYNGLLRSIAECPVVEVQARFLAKS